MIIDFSLEMANAQAVTVSAASTDVVDLTSAPQDLGMACEPLALTITCQEDAAASGAATVQMALQQSSDNSTFTDVVMTGAIGKAAITKGQQFVLPIPPGALTGRYARAYFTVATGPLTAGKFHVSLGKDVQKNKAYPDAI